MDIQFWGVRGSIPSPGPDTAQFGGNTACVTVRVPGEPFIILDAGTGIRKLGLSLVQNPDIEEIHLFLSHTHWDHIQGLPFFAPLFIPKYTIKLYGPIHYAKNLEEILSQQMEYTYFPVRVEELAAKISFHDIAEQEIKLGEGVVVRTKFVNHPVVCLSYRIEHAGKSFVYMTDHEPYRNLFEAGDEATAAEGAVVSAEQTEALVHFASEADLLVIDAQYTREEYPSRIGWGHSSLDAAYDLAHQAHVKEMTIFHHDPDRTDAAAQKMLNDLQNRVFDHSTESIPIRLSKEQLCISL